MPESNNKPQMQKATSQVWSPENPHPLAKMKTELVWEGKYDEYGNRRPVKLPASALPSQRIETIDEPREISTFWVNYLTGRAARPREGGAGQFVRSRRV